MCTRAEDLAPRRRLRQERLRFGLPFFFFVERFFLDDFFLALDFVFVDLRALRVLRLDLRLTRFLGAMVLACYYSKL